MNRQPGNILIFKPGAVGDLLQLSPVLRALKKSHPRARITLLVGNTASIDLFRHNPLVDEILVYEKRGAHRSWRAFARLWLELRRRRFDLVVNYQRSNLKGWLLAAAAFPCRVLVYHKEKKQVVHAVHNHLQAVEPVVGAPHAHDHGLELHLGPVDEGWAAELFARESLNGRPVVALNLGASHPVNRWPTWRFAELAGQLQSAGIGVVLVGGATDRELADAVLAKTSSPPLDLVGRTSLLQLGALLKLCSAVVSADTGPMHLATAVGTPVIALFGAADPGRTGPVGQGHLVLQAGEVPCVPCRSRSCRHTPPQECMERISAAQVRAALALVLKEGAGDLLLGAKFD